MHAKTFQCWTLVTPWTVTHQVPLSVGFSRQEYCSGLACPPQPEDLPDPGIKPVSAICCTGRWVLPKCVYVCTHARLVAQSCLTLCNPMDCSPPGSSASRDFPGKNIDWSGLPCPPPRDLPNPWIKPSLPHCRQIYHLSHQGSPHTSHIM